MSEFEPAVRGPDLGHRRRAVDPVAGGQAVAASPASIRDDGASAAWMIYVAYIIGFFVPFVAGVGVLFAYVNRDPRAPFAPHFSFQIRTFWRGLLILAGTFLLWLVALAGVASNHPVALLPPIGLVAWFYISTIARVSRGLRALNRGETSIDR